MISNTSVPIRILIVISWLLTMSQEVFSQTNDSLPIVARNVNNPSSAEAVEGCVDGVFTFYKRGNPFFERTFTVRLEGTAQNGVDYQQINISQVVIPVGRDSTDLVINPVLDSLPEGNETIILIATSNSITDTITLTIKDLPVLTLNLDTSICEEEPLTFTHTSIPGATTFNWTPSTGLNDPTLQAPTLFLSVDEDQRFTYFLTEIDSNLCEASDALTVSVRSKPLSNFSGPTNLCAGTTGQFNYIGTADSNAVFQWDFGTDATVSGDINGPGPLEVSWETSGTRQVCLTVSDSVCTHETFCSTIEVGIAPDVSISPIFDQCFEGHALTFSPTDSVDVDTYRWNFGTDAQIPTASVSKLEDFTYTQPGIKTVSLIVTKDGCTRGDQISFELAETPSANFELLDNTFCKDACVRPSYQGEILGVAQTFEWVFGGDAIPDTSLLRNPLCSTYGSAGEKQIKLSVFYKGCVSVDSQSINILELPVANVEAGRDTGFCENESGIQLNASVTGGSEELTYNWFANLPDESNWGIQNEDSPTPFVNPQVDQTPKNVTYYFFVQTENGCLSNIDSLSVRVKAIPEVDAGPDRIVCENDPGVLLLGKPAPNNRAPSPFQYKWSPNLSLSDTSVANPLAFPDENTTYTLRATSINGCSSILIPGDTLTSTNVIVQPLPSAIVRQDTSICLGDTLMLEGSALGTGNSFQYRWTPTSTGFIKDSTISNPQVSPSISTIYSLVVTENGCNSRAANIKVTIKPRPSVTIRKEQSICLGESVQLEALAFSEVENLDPFTYQWSPANTLGGFDLQRPVATPDTTTEYQFTAFSNEGCPSEILSTIVIVKPSPIAIIQRDTSLICLGDSLNLRAGASFTTTPPGSPLSYEWNPTDSIFTRDRFAESIMIRPKTSQWYTLTTSISGDCPNEDSVWIEVLTLSDVQIDLQDSIICEGETLQLSLQGDTNNLFFTWFPNEGLSGFNDAEPIVSPTQTTTYTLVTNKSGCEDTLIKTIEVISAPIADFLYSDTSGCTELSVAFLENSSFADVLVWNFGDGTTVSNQTNPVHTFQNPGTYEVTLTALGPNGCITESHPLLISVSDSVKAQFETDIQPGDTLQIPNASVQFTDLSINATSWLWSFGDGNTSTEQSPLHEYWIPGTHTITLTVTDKFGCSDQIVLKEILVQNPELFIPNVFTPNEDGINDQFRIIYRGQGAIELIIFDRWGEEQYRTNSLELPWNGTTQSGEQAPEGVYFYRLKLDGNSHKGEITLLR